MKCENCGKDFASAQALGSHRNHCSGKALAVRQAEVVARQVGVRTQADSRLLTLDSRPLGQDSRPSNQLRTETQDPWVKTLDSRLLTTLRPSPQYQTYQPRELSIPEYRSHVDEVVERDKLRKKEQYARRSQTRTFAIVLAMAGVALYFWAGGKIKLPFFGDAG